MNPDKPDNIFRQWTSSIDLARAKVTRFPSFIFLCGGPIAKNGQPFKSCRDIFYSHIKKSTRQFRDKVLLAEEVFHYFDHSSYQDLLCFERDLAEISALTVIFTESPGSIAELGSFAVLQPIQEKLLIVMHRDDAEKESFIWRGPVMHIQEAAKAKRKKDPVTAYNWHKRTREDDSLSENDFSDAEELAETMEEFLSNLPKSQSFKKKEVGHVMLLILDLLKVVLLATLEEIETCLKLFGIEPSPYPGVAQQLSLLSSLNLVTKKRYSNNVYYLSTQPETWLTWAYAKSATVRDVDRWKEQFKDYYSEHIPRKMKAWRTHLIDTGQIGD